MNLDFFTILSFIVLLIFCICLGVSFLVEVKKIKKEERKRKSRKAKKGKRKKRKAARKKKNLYLVFYF